VGQVKSCILDVAELHKYLFPAESQLGKAFDSKRPILSDIFGSRQGLCSRFKCCGFRIMKNGMGTRIRHLSFNKRSRVSDETLLLFFFFVD
jgi:hypothetical protein